MPAIAWRLFTCPMVSCVSCSALSQQPQRECISCSALPQQPQGDGAKFHCLEALQCKLNPAGCRAGALCRLASASHVMHAVFSPACNLTPVCSSLTCSTYCVQSCLDLYFKTASASHATHALSSPAWVLW